MFASNIQMKSDSLCELANKDYIIRTVNIKSR